MRNLRKKSEIRKPKITDNFCPAAEGSILYEIGNTRLICAASVSTDVPFHAENRGEGWVTAEYSLLPYSTNPRTKPSLLKKDGRAVEIQRLIGRSLRGVVDLKKLSGFSITLDCDVIQADGGTRTAAITGGFIALSLAIKKLLDSGEIKENPIISNIAAISLGYINKELYVDLEYSEDSSADVDMNIVMDGNFDLIEIQGTGERATFSQKQLNEMLDEAKNAIKQLFNIQNDSLKLN